MKAIFIYPGSKWGIAKWIIEHFPENYEKMVYLEPFLGSGAVFFNKRPGIVETINDIDGDVVNLFCVLRNQPDALQAVLALTPYSREEYDRAFEHADDTVENARRFIVRTTQAIGAKMYGRCGWRNHKQPNIGGTACKWAAITDTIDAAAARLRGTTTNLVQIECMDALELIGRYDTADALIYIDPPYVIRSRKSGKLYRHEMSDERHIEMLELISNSRAKIILSGYHSELYNRFLRGWYRDSTLSQTTSTQKAEEVIWMNYKPPVIQMKFDMEADYSG